MDQNERPFPGDYISYAHYDNTGVRRVAQLAPQYLSVRESVSSIPRHVQYVPPRVQNVASSYPSSMVFAVDNNSGVVTNHEFMFGHFTG